MSYIKIQKIKKENLNDPDFIPEKGYVYLGYDDQTVDGVNSGLWLKDDDGSDAFYILAQNNARPVISQFFPTNYASNGNTISIYGENFIPFSTTVTFNGVPGINVTVLSSIQLTVVVPNVSGEVEVIVTTGYGYSAPKNYNIIHVNINPIIIPPIIPSESSVGSEITINGANFVVGDSIVWFGGISGQTTVLNSTLINTIIPNINTGHTLIFVENVTANDQSNSVDYFINNTNVTFTDFYPKYGYSGDTITLSGTNFAQQKIQVSFGSTKAYDINVISPTYCTAKISSDTPIGDTSIRINTVILDGFTVCGTTTTLLPTISSIYPISAHSGETITIVGTNLGGDLSITFGGVKVNVISNLNDQATIYLGGDVIPGSNSVYVVNKYGRSINPYNYRIESEKSGEPIINWFTPTSVHRGGVVEIHGSNFVIGSNNVTYFGNIISPQTQCIISDNYRAIVSPASPSGLVDIKIVNSNGAYSMTGLTILNDTLIQPIITSISHNYAKAGDEIQIYGSNFDQGSVSIGFSYPGFSTSTTYINSNQLSIIIPSGLVNAGENKLYTIFVTTPSGTTSYSPIDIYALPLISPSMISFTPTSGITGTMITINGSNFSKYWTDASVYINGEYYILDSQKFISNNKITGYIPNTNGNYGACTIKVSTPIGVYQKSPFIIIAPDYTLNGFVDCFM